MYDVCGTDSLSLRLCSPPLIHFNSISCFAGSRSRWHFYCLVLDGTRWWGRRVHLHYLVQIEKLCTRPKEIIAEQNVKTMSITLVHSFHASVAHQCCGLSLALRPLSAIFFQSIRWWFSINFLFSASGWHFSASSGGDGHCSHPVLPLTTLMTFVQH